MKRYMFHDTATGKDLIIESDSISGAFLESLEKVMDGEAIHPLFVGEV